jgi:hypothetical protein
MKVLFISAWYPNRYDEMAGLFVRKHAQAVSQFCDVEVLYIHPATDINRFEICVKNIDKLKETTVYFPAKSNNSVQKTDKATELFNCLLQRLAATQKERLLSRYYPC